MDEELRARLRDQSEPICVPNETAPFATYLSRVAEARRMTVDEITSDSYFVLSKVSLPLPYPDISSHALSFPTPPSPDPTRALSCPIAIRTPLIELPYTPLSLPHTPLSCPIRP